MSKPSIEILEKCIPQIVILPDAYVKMQLYTEECENEIGWLGTAYKKRDKEKTIYYIEDTFLFEQEVHITTTEITPESLCEFGEALFKKEDGMKIWNNIKVWGHSHVNMSVSPSGQDNSQMETFIESGHNWFIRIITNKKNDMRIDLYDYELGAIFNNLPWTVAMSKEEEKIEEQINELYQKLKTLQEDRIKKYRGPIKSEILLKVKNKVHYYPQYQYQYFGKYLNNDSLETNEKKNHSTHVISNHKNKITCINDVYETLPLLELMDIGECHNLMEVIEVLKLYGDDDFTHEELLLIWTASQEIVKATYFS